MGGRLFSTLNDRAIKIEGGLLPDQSGKRSFCKSVFTFNKPYSKTFIYTTEINAYLIVTYLKTIFCSTGYQSVFLNFTYWGVSAWHIQHPWCHYCYVFPFHFLTRISSDTLRTFPPDKYCLGTYRISPKQLWQNESVNFANKKKSIPSPFVF